MGVPPGSSNPDPISDQNIPFSTPFSDLAPVVQRLDNFIQWIRHLTVSICAKISVFPLVQANMHTLTTAKFVGIRNPWTTFNSSRSEVNKSVGAKARA